ncbi:hypothetical protein WICPIJ_003991 [Wickerhamomyces pijperi]|uniref:Uncharacterized protein n=1 Tax=Wickerhamomyces pijperi TaxID=599730 RepID=A0A9P8TNC9_WICPI|nr:hypothetical protein WICPIJ_003991 [Wickerhamomyces pijperi]
MTAPAKALPPSNLTPLPPADLQRGTSGNLDLSSNDINTGDFFSDGVFDLDTWVDLDEVVSVLIVNQEFSSTGVSVVGSLGQFDSIG